MTENNEGETPVPASTGMDELNKVAEMRYKIAMMQFLMNAEGMSKKSILRAITNAVDLPVQSGLAKPFVDAKYKGRGQLEMNSAALFAQLLDMRNLIQANLLTKKSENNKQAQESQGESENVETSTNNQ